MAHFLHLRLDRDTDRALRNKARAEGMTVSELGRLLLRKGLLAMTGRQAGYAEGKMQGFGEVQERVARAAFGNGK